MRLSRLAFLLPLLAASPLFAGTQDINLQATVPETCIIGGGPSPEAVTEGIPVTSGMVSNYSTTLTFSIHCNKASSLTLASVNAGLQGPANANGSFSNKVHYQVSTSGLFPSASLNTATQTGTTTVQSTGAVTGNLSVALSTGSSQGPLVAGQYADTLRVTVVPLP